MDGGGAGVASIDEPDRPDVIGLYQVDFGGTETVARESEFEELTDLSAIGGLVTKGISPLPRFGNQTPRICETASGMLNSIGLENVGVDGFERDKLPYLRTTGASVFDWVIANHTVRAFSMGEKGQAPWSGGLGEGRESD